MSSELRCAAPLSGATGAPSAGVTAVAVGTTVWLYDLSKRELEISASTAALAQAPRSKRQLFSSLKRLRKRPPTSTRRPLQRRNGDPTFALQKSLSIKPSAGRTAFFKLSIMQNIFCITSEVRQRRPTRRRRRRRHSRCLYRLVRLTFL